MSQSNLRILTLAEWQTEHLNGVVLTSEDRRLVDSLAAGAAAGTGGGRLAIDELRSGVRITARSWVGVVRFSTFKLRVVPKLAGGDLGLVRLIDYAAGLGAMERHAAVHALDVSGASLLDLVALLLAEACQRIAGGGLLAEYYEHEDDLPVLRGRLRLREQVLRRYGRIDRLACRYDEHATDVPENRLLLAALAACARRCVHPLAALAVRRTLPVFEEACTLEDLDLRDLRKNIDYDRKNERYRQAHALAWLVLDGIGLDDLYGGAHHRAFAFLLDMNRLFEDFAGRWLNDVLAGSGYRVLSQRRDRTILWDAGRGRPYASVIPDFLVQRADEAKVRLPVDAKYKLYDERGLSPGDVYQCFLYASAYGERFSGASDLPPTSIASKLTVAAIPLALLLYPATAPDGNGVRLHVRDAGGAVRAEVRSLPVHIPTALAEVASGRIGLSRRRLLQVVQEDVVFPSNSGGSTG